MVLSSERWKEKSFKAMIVNVFYHISEKAYKKKPNIRYFTIFTANAY